MAQQQYASRSEIEEVLEAMPESFIECRDLQHRWRPYTASWDGSTRVFDRQLRCSRCRTLKVQVLSETGAVLSSHYEYPKNYLLKLGRIVGDGRDAVRLASVTRRIGQNGA